MTKGRETAEAAATAGRGTAAAAWDPGCAGPPRVGIGGDSVLLASLAVNLLSLALPLVILQVFDRILPNAATDTLLLLVIGLSGVLLLDGFFRAARAYLTGWGAARLEHVTGCRAVERMLASDIRHFEAAAPGVHLDRLYAIDQLREYHAGQARLTVVDLPFVAVFLALVWVIGGPLVLVPLSLLLLLAACGVRLGLALRAALRTRAALDNRRYSFIIEVLSRIYTVKLLAMEPLLLRRYERLQESGAEGTYRTTLLSNMTQSLGNLFSNLVMVAVAAVGAGLVINGQMSIGGLAACTLLSGRSVQPLLRGLGIWTQIQGVALAKERVAQVFALPLEHDATAGDRAPAGEIEGAITLSQVTFGYDPQAPLFEAADLTVAPGEVVGISGDTGCGKTSLLMLTMGLLRPSAGRVRFDGKDAAEYDAHALRRQIAFLPQSAELFRGTILENLTMFGTAAQVDEALAAARMLGLHEKIHRLPGGYDTEVGDGSAEQLPSGLRQMIAIARALAGRRRIILFDEANSAFDGPTDARFKQALAALKGETTMILVSHRPSLLALADRVYDIRAGRLELRDAAPATNETASEKGPGRAKRKAGT